MTAEPEVKTKQAISGYSGRKWVLFCFFFFLEVSDMSGKIQRSDPYAECPVYPLYPGCVPAWYTYA